VFGNARGETLHVVAAFEQRENASAAVTLCRFDNSRGDLPVRLLRHAHAAEGVAAVGVETGGEEDRVRAVVVDHAHDVVLDRAHVGRVTLAGVERDVLREAAPFADADFIAARGSDLPGVTTARILEQIIEGYAGAMEPGQTGEEGDDIPEAMRAAVKTARRRSWQHLAKERIENIKPTIPLGKRFWPLATDERSEITRLFEKDHVRQLATMLRSRKDNAPVDMLDAAYWKKGCSSLGKLRYCVLLGVGDKQLELCLMDLKEAVQAAAPADDSADMPEDQAQRVVEGARHLSPHLGERMRAIQLFGRSIFIRELLPQDLKIELETLTREQAMNIARFLANVVGKAHARQMDEDTRSKWAKELSRSRSGHLKAPSWLWSSVVDLLAIHEKAYLEHCRLYALNESH